MAINIRTTINLIFASAIIGFVHAEDVGRNEFRREKGAYTFDANGSVLEFITAKDGRLSVSIDYRFQSEGSRSSSKTGFGDKGIFKKEGWFVFFESPERIWLFDGIGDLTLVEHKRSGVQATTNVRGLDKEAMAL